MIKENLETIRKKIRISAEKSNRNPEEIKLVAVSKTRPIEDILSAYNASQKAFGENYAQDFKAKAEELNNCDIEWHFIGHLQRNKVKYVLPYVHMIHTLDSIKLAEEISKRTEKPIKCLIEINIGNENSKYGIKQENIFDFLRKISIFRKVKITGLMTIPPYSENPELSRPYFKQLRLILDKINAENIYKNQLTELSMGMSSDFEIAIEEGATIVRVGSAIFGIRKNV